MIFKKSGPPEWLLVCLGNYGKEYENTRHNVGFMAAERLIDKRDLRCNRLRFRALTEVIDLGGAKKVYACASHGVLSGPALERLEASCIEELALLDTIPAPVGEAELAKARIKYLTVAPMFAEAIERTYQEISIAKLFN